jgi:hypothetical protein
MPKKSPEPKPITQSSFKNNPSFPTFPLPFNFYLPIFWLQINIRSALGRRSFKTGTTVSNT